MDSRLHDQDILISKYPLRWPDGERRIKHYSNLHQILLVGEGDFSFSAALANAFGSADNMVPTSLDSRDRIINSYMSGQNNLNNLEKRGAMIFHGVDATTMSRLEIMRERKFDRIVYNFPHAGFFGKEKDDKVIEKHRHLLYMFFKNGMTMLNKMGEIHVTHKEKDPYDKWKLVEQAEKCGLLLKESVEFYKEDYPGYTNRKGAGPDIGQPFFLGDCRTYMFILREFMTTPTVLPKISLQGHPKTLKAAILELETERQNRKAAETAKENLESSFNDLRTVADKNLKERDEFRRQKDEALREKAKITKQLAEARLEIDHALRQKEKIAKELYEALRLKEEERHEFRRQRDNALHQKDEVWRDKENMAKQLAEALRLKEDAAKQRDVSILELEFERKARKDAETAKANIAGSLSHYKASVYDMELQIMNQLVRQRDDALYQKEAACREKEKIAREKGEIAKQLDEALRLQEEARIDLANQKEEIIRNIVVCCGLGCGIKIISSVMKILGLQKGF